MKTILSDNDLAIIKAWLKEPDGAHTAIMWLENNVAMGCARAQFRLAKCLERGTGVPSDINEAMKLYTLAASQGHAGAMFNLGTLYKHGEGIPQDLNKAASFYQSAADHGYRGAQREAARLYYKAAKQGNPEAQLNFAKCLIDGKGVKPNLMEAVRFYTLAANQGHDDELLFLRLTNEMDKLLDKLKSEQPPKAAKRNKNPITPQSKEIICTPSEKPRKSVPCHTRWQNTLETPIETNVRARRGAPHVNGYFR
jgi:TPR repeat protein